MEGLQAHNFSLCVCSALNLQSEQSRTKRERLVENGGWRWWFIFCFIFSAQIMEGVKAGNIFTLWFTSCRQREDNRLE